MIHFKLMFPLWYKVRVEIHFFCILTFNCSAPFVEKLSFPQWITLASLLNKVDPVGISFCPLFSSVDLYDLPLHQ